MKTIPLSVFVLGFLVGASGSATPCNGIDRRLSESSKKEFGPIIAKQLTAEAVDVLKQFRFGKWRIVYVSTNDSDNAFLFFASNSKNAQYLTTWGGGAGAQEEGEILQWVLKNAQGIPSRLAKCFAWHVTNNRDA